ncbi:hypothetical protein [Mycobacterium conspicuum]|nr:hypothetical protein [Mycobacterium conspicuum]
MCVGSGCIHAAATGEMCVHGWPTGGQRLDDLLGDLLESELVRA